MDLISRCLFCFHQMCLLSFSTDSAAGHFPEFLGQHNHSSHSAGPNHQRHPPANPDPDQPPGHHHPPGAGGGSTGDTADSIPQPHPAYYWTTATSDSKPGEGRSF